MLLDSKPKSWAQHIHNIFYWEYVVWYNLYSFTSELVTHTFWAWVARNDTEKHFLLKNKLEKMSKREILFFLDQNSFLISIFFECSFLTDFQIIRLCSLIFNDFHWILDHCFWSKKRAFPRNFEVDPKLDRASEKWSFCRSFHLIYMRWEMKGGEKGGEKEVRRSFFIWDNRLAYFPYL